MAVDETIAKLMERESKKWPGCDYKGKCQNKAFMEVYPSLLGGKCRNKGWNYLCRKHYNQEQNYLKGKLPHCRAEAETEDL